MDGNLAARGNLVARKISAPTVGIGWKISNLPHIIPGFMKFELAKFFGLPSFMGTLEAKLIRRDGSVLDYGLISTAYITTAWVTAMATYMFDGSGVVPTAYDYHAAGTGTNAENITDTQMQSDSGVARNNGTPTNPSAGLYRSVGTLAFTTGLAITEHGIFSASTVGTLMDRSVFSAINVVNGDSIQFTYTLTLTAGG